MEFLVYIMVISYNSFAPSAEGKKCSKSDMDLFYPWQEKDACG